MASAWNKFTDFRHQLGLGTHNLSGHTFKLALTNAAVDASMDELADITQIAASGGYTSGGYALTVSWSGGKWIVSDLQITGTGAAIPTFQRAVLYNDSSTGDKLVGWYDYGAAINVAEDAEFTFNFDDVNGVFGLS